MKIKDANLKPGDKFTVEFEIVRNRSQGSTYACDVRAAGVKEQSLNIIYNDTEITNIKRVPPVLSVGLTFTYPYLEYTWTIISMSEPDRVVMAKKNASHVSVSNIKIFTFDEVYGRLAALSNV